MFFAIQVRTGLPAMVARLNGMRARGEAMRGQAEAEADTGDEMPAVPQDIHYSHRNNLVVACLARDGMIYLRNKGFWDSLDFDLSAAGPGILANSVAVFALSAGGFRPTQSSGTRVRRLSRPLHRSREGSRAGGMA